MKTINKRKATVIATAIIFGMIGFGAGKYFSANKLTAKEQDYMTYLELMNRSDKDIEACLKKKFPSKVKGWQKIMEESAIEHKFVEGRDEHELNRIIKSMKDSAERNYNFVKEQGCDL